MKAGKSSDIVAVLPSRATNAFAASKVSSLVAMPRMISTSCIRGTGFMKCMPMKRSGLAVTEASRVIEIDEVLEATIASGFRNGRSAVKILRLTSSFSDAASMTRSQSPSSSSRRRADAPEDRLAAVLVESAPSPPDATAGR